MGVLSDTPVRTATRGGEGQKFVDLYRSMDDDDRAKIRRWVADPFMSTSEIWRRLAQHFDIGRSSVERGLARLEATSWEC